MAFTLDELTRLRPFLFHLTARENLARIRRVGELESAERLLVQVGRLDLLETRRRDHVPLVVEGETVVLRDQAPLHAGNMHLADGWTFAQFVRSLNSRVFFWPGGVSGPISYGTRHYQRYAGEAPVILRVPFAAMLEANPGAVPLLCRYNSGSPRWSYGIAAPRGAMTFVSAGDAAFRAAQVVEVTLTDIVRLPPSVMTSSHPSGPWEPL